MISQKNKFFIGENLDSLRYIPSSSIDLVYIDPPFNKKVDFSYGNFKFSDKWNNTISPDQMQSIREIYPSLSDFLIFMRSQNMSGFYYLSMISLRLIEIKRVLKPTGSIYVQCDNAASHYLKICLDLIFGLQNFRNEIIWKRTSAHSNVSKKYGAITDTLFFYTVSDNYTWNQQYVPYSDDHVDDSFSNVDENGRYFSKRDLTASMLHASSGQLYEWHGITPPPSRCWAMTKENMDKLYEAGKIYIPKKKGGTPRLKLYLDEMSGVPVQNIWEDINPVGSQADEKIGYPTQKPLALLERIISTSSNEGNVILDTFMGSATTLVAAQKLARTWIGMDNSHDALFVAKQRLKNECGLSEEADYHIIWT